MTNKETNNKETLKNKYKIDIGEEETAKAILEKFKFFEKYKSLNYYKFSQKGEIVGFYPRVLAEKVYKKYKCVNTTGQYEDLLVYDNGVYKKSNKIRNEINKSLLRLDQKPNNRRIATLTELAEITKLDYNSFNANKDLINFNNGIYNIRNDTMYRHDEKFLSTIRINIDYTPVKEYDENKIKKTLFWKFINTSLEKELVSLFQEILGYFFSLSLEVQKFFVLLGDGQNGKTQLLKIINAFFDKEYISSLDLCAAQDPTRVKGLYNKVINSCGDISAKYLESVDLIKRLTGEDPISCNPKYKDEFEFYNIAKMIFSCNELPNVSDKTYAFIRRLIIIPFKSKIKEKDKISGIANKIIENKEEMNLIGEWAIEGLKKLIARNFEFELPEQSIFQLDEYEKDNNNVKRFISDYCVLNNDGFIPVVEFKRLYKIYCRIENYSEIGNKNLKSVIRSFEIEEKSKTKYKARYYNNISWSKDIMQMLKDYQENDLDIKGVIYDSEIYKKYEDIEREGIKEG